MSRRTFLLYFILIKVFQFSAEYSYFRLKRNNSLPRPGIKIYFVLARFTTVNALIDSGMKNIIFLSCLLLGIVTFGSHAVMAQNISFGGGMGYGSESERLSFYGNLHYALPTAPVKIGTVLGYTLQEKNDNREIARLRGNLNGYLMAIDKSYISLYGLTGLSVLRSKTTTETNEGSYTDVDVLPGANIGAGAEVAAGVGRYFAEGKYIIGHEDIAGFVFSTGIRVGL
jgi:hypothetical protein